MLFVLGQTEAKILLACVLSIGISRLLQIVYHIQIMKLVALSQNRESGCMLHFAFTLFSPACVPFCLFIYLSMCAFSFISAWPARNFSSFLFLVLASFLFPLCPMLRELLGSELDAEKGKTLQVFIKDVNSDTQVKVKNRSRQWKTLNHRISCWVFRA